MTSALALDMENGGQEVTVDADGMTLDAMGLPTVVVDAASDPERANALTAAALKEDDEEKEFSISGPPDGSVQLVAGYVTDDGRRFTTAEVRELRGRDEETLARALATGDLTRYLDTIVRTGVVQLGDITDEKELAGALDTLLLGDRDVLILQIRRLAYGDTTRLDVVCPHCDHQFQVDYSFSSDVPIKGFSVEGVTDLSLRNFDLECPSGKSVSIRLVDGRAQKAVYATENMKKTDAELNTLLLRQLVSSIDNVPVKGVGPILDMPAKDRKFLLEWLAAGQPGPRYGDVKQECPDCLREFPLVMTIREMFRGD